MRFVYLIECRIRESQDNKLLPREVSQFFSVLIEFFLRKRHQLVYIAQDVESCEVLDEI